VRYRWIGILLLLLALLWLLYVLLHLDPARTGLALLLICGGYRLVRSAGMPGRRSTLVGVVHLMDRDYPLHNIALSCAIADVKIDLSRAIIPPGEHVIDIRGLVGDVAIYVPYDLAVSVATRRRTFVTDGYAGAISKVIIAVSLTVGDIDVRYL
jgi:predicted membrane protein